MPCSTVCSRLLARVVSCQRMPEMASQALLGIIFGSCVVAAVEFVKWFPKTAPLPM